MVDTSNSDNANVPPAMDVPTANQDARGRFLPGHKLGGAKLTHGRMQQYRKAFFAAVTDEGMQEMARAMLAIACQGDVAAARFVGDHCLGKVIEAEMEVEQGDVPGRLVINLVSAPAKN